MRSCEIYLDNAATSFPKPEAVYDAVDDYQRHCGAAYSRGIRAEDHADTIVYECRQMLADLIGAPDASCVAMTFSATDGLNLLLRGLLRPGARVVTTTLEHNSVLRPLRQLQQLSDVHVTHVPFDPVTGMVSPDDFRAALRTGHVDLAAVSLVSNVTGIPQPIEELATAAHEAGAVVMADAAQAVGHCPVDVQRAGIDLLAASGHKGLLGPLGTGFLWAAPELHDRLIPVRCGGTGTHSESLDPPGQMPQLFESGNLNMPGIAGLKAALKWHVSEESRNLREAFRWRVRRLLDGLSRISGVTVLCSASAARSTGVISVTVRGYDSREAAEILYQSFGIRCRAGLHCAALAHDTLRTRECGGTLRLSPGLMTTDEDIDRALDAVNAVAAAGS